MKQFLLSVAFLLFTLVGFGQCPTQNSFLITSQQELNQFIIDYPNCTVLETNLSIFGSDITDLTPLSNLTDIGVEIGATGSLDIHDCPNLISLNGLQNLEFTVSLNFNNIGITDFSGLENLQRTSSDFTILKCDNLIDFTGLNTLFETGTFKIMLNENLINLNGLEALNSIDGTGQHQIVLNPNLLNVNGLDNLQTIIQDIIISNNEQLQNLDALFGVVNLTGIQIGSNANLNSISGLSNVDPLTINNIISISNNPNLSECNINFVCENLQNQDIILEFDTNATGCNSIPEVEFECSIVNIPDSNFLNAILSHTPTIDTNSDNLIQFDEAEAFSGTLNVANKVIIDFTGLEAFVNSTGFNGSGNFISKLSLEANTALTSLDFSGCTDVTKVLLKNGNNTAITSFNGVDCPSLQFVCVDDVDFAKNNFTNIDTQVVFVDDCEFLAIEDFNLAETISLFPNPVSKTLTISNTSNFSILNTEIYSISGQKLKETSALQINMSQLSVGVYFVKVNTEKGNVTKKIVKQ